MPETRQGIRQRERTGVMPVVRPHHKILRRAEFPRARSARYLNKNDVL